MAFPPFYNFAVLPKAEGIDPFTEAKENGTAYAQPGRYQPPRMRWKRSVKCCLNSWAALLTWHQAT